MKLIPTNSGTKLRLVGAAAAGRAATPKNWQRVSPLVRTTVSLTNGPGGCGAAEQAAVANTPVAVTKTEAPQPAAQAAQGNQPPPRKRARVGAHRPDAAKDQPRPEKGATGGKPARNAKPQARARESTKKETVLALLRRPQGATLAEMRKATGWQAHTVRGFLSGALRKHLGLKVKSGKRDNGERVYSIRS